MKSERESDEDEGEEKGEDVHSRRSVNTRPRCPINNTTIQQFKSRSDKAFPGPDERSFRTTMTEIT